MFEKLRFTPGLVFVFFWFRRYIAPKQPFMPIMIESLFISWMKLENMIYFDPVIAIEERISSFEYICVSLDIAAVLRFDDDLPH